MDVTGEQIRPNRYEFFPPFAEWADVQVNELVWDGYAERLRELLPDHRDEQVDLPHRRSLIAAAALNSGAIEGLHGAGRGLTQSVIEQSLEWQPVVRQAEGSEAQALVAACIEAFDMALDVATGTEQLSEVWIRSVHETVCAPQKLVRVFSERNGQRLASNVPFLRGSYKLDPNNVELVDGSVHWYCPVEEVSREMHRLVEELRSPAFEAAHPILQAAFAHHAFVAVHPFQDGNGRVARLLASIYLLRAASIPLFIYDDEKHRYFDALEAADRGDRSAFVSFVEGVAVDTLAYACDLAATSSGQMRVTLPNDRIAEDLRLAGLRLEAFVDREFLRLGAEIDVVEPIKRTWETISFGSRAKGDLGRWPVSEKARLLRIESDVSKAGASRHLRVFVCESLAGPLPVSVAVNSAGTLLELRFDEVSPSITTRAQARLSAAIKRVVSELVVEAQAEVDKRGG